MDLCEHCKGQGGGFCHINSHLESQVRESKKAQNLIPKWYESFARLLDELRPLYSICQNNEAKELYVSALKMKAVLAEKLSIK